MQPLKAGDTIAARIDGAAVNLTTEERQYIEPSAYCHEAGWWCVSGEDDSLYFVSDDGIEETLYALSTAGGTGRGTR